MQWNLKFINCVLSSVTTQVTTNRVEEITKFMKNGEGHYLFGVMALRGVGIPNDHMLFDGFEKIDWGSNRSHTAIVYMIKWWGCCDRNNFNCSQINLNNFPWRMYLLMNYYFGNVQIFVPVGKLWSSIQYIITLSLLSWWWTKSFKELFKDVA